MPGIPDTDAIEALLRELEEGDTTTRHQGSGTDGEKGRKKKKRGARGTAGASSAAADAAGGAPEGSPAPKPWEFNPHADAEEQQKLQNLVDVDALLGRKPDPAPVARPARLPTMATGAVGTTVAAGGSDQVATPPKTAPLRKGGDINHHHGEGPHPSFVASPKGDDASSAPPAAEGAASPFRDDVGNVDGGLFAKFAVRRVNTALGAVPISIRHGHTATALADRFVIFFGGVKAQANDRSSNCVVFDTATASLEPVVSNRGDAPSSRSMHAATAVDLSEFGVSEHMVVVGGKASNGVVLRDAHLFSVKDQEWAPIDATGKQPSARFGHSASAIGHKVFVFGGRVAKQQASEQPQDAQPQQLQCSSDMYLLDLKRNAWLKVTGKADDPSSSSAGDVTTTSSSAVHPAKRYGHASCVSSDGTAVFIHGGMTSQSTVLGDLWKYDIATRSWLEISRANSVPRTRHSMFFVDDNIIVVGGVATHMQASRSAAQASFVSSLSVASPNWTPHTLVGSVQPSPSRAGAAVALVNGVLVAHGGTAPSESPDDLKDILATTISASLFPLDTPVTNAVGYATPGIAALHASLERLSSPFDLVVHYADGEEATPPLGFHRSLLRLRAPKLLTALEAFAVEGGAGGVKPAPHAAGDARHCLMTVSRKNRDMLSAIGFDRARLAAVRDYIYTGRLFATAIKGSKGTVDTVAAADLIDDVLSPAAEAFELESLGLAISKLRLGGGASAAAASPADSPAATPSKAQTTTASKRIGNAAHRAECEAVAQNDLLLSLERAVDDNLTCDAVFVLIAADPDAYRAEVSVQLHSVVACAQSPPLRRLLVRLLAPRERYKSQSSAVASAPVEDRSSGLRATRRSNGTVAITSLDSATHRLPEMASALVVVAQHLHVGGCMGLSDTNAVEVLTAARILELAALAAAAERVIASALDGSGQLEPRDLVALAQLAEGLHAEHVGGRVAVAAASCFDEVLREPAFAQLPRRAQDELRTVARQSGWRGASGEK